MAVTVINGGAGTAAVTLASATAFVVSEATTILAENFAVGEVALVYILGPSGSYMPVTNKEGTVFLSHFPSVGILDAPGTYKITKPLNDSASAILGYGS